MAARYTTLQVSHAVDAVTVCNRKGGFKGDLRHTALGFIPRQLIRPLLKPSGHTVIILVFSVHSDDDDLGFSRL